MIKKIVLLSIILIFSSISSISIYAEDPWSTNSVWSTDADRVDADAEASKSANTVTCDWEDCLNSPNFMIATSDISPWTKDYNWWSIKETSKNILTTIIQSLMVAIGVVALLVMSIGAWFMIFHHWEDWMLAKWKTMFTTWITALIIALSSYYLVSLLRYLLYTWN